MPQFRKKPVVIEAIKWDGKLDTYAKIVHPSFNKLNRHVSAEASQPIKISTLEGVHEGNVGDWIIQGVKGEIYPCKPDIFKETYEEVK